MTPRFAGSTLVLCLLAAGCDLVDASSDEGEGSEPAPVGDMDASLADASADASLDPGTPLDAGSGASGPVLSAEGCEAQRVAEPLEVQTERVNGSEFVHASPPEPAGLVVLAHGGGGSKEDMVALQPEAVRIARGLVEAGYAVAALDSAAHVLVPDGAQFRWSDDDTDANVDVVNGRAMIDRLRDADDLAVVASDAPVFLLGVSHGGSFVSRLAQHVPVTAAAVYISNAVAFLDEGASIPPLMMVPAQNDPGRARTSNSELLDIIEAGGGEGVYHLNLPGPLTPGVFTRLPGVDCPLSKSIVEALRAGQWLDEQDELTRNPKSDRAWADLLPPAAASLDVAIRSVLLELYAEHSPSGDWNPELVAFFDAHR